MINYKLRLIGEESGKSNEIVIDNLEGNASLFTNIEFKIEQKNTETKAKGGLVVKTLLIEGVINEQTKEVTKKLADWSLQEKHFYKTLSLKIVNENNDILRNYYSTKMFCMSYSESFSDEVTGCGQFVLQMQQAASGESNNTHIDIE